MTGRSWRSLRFAVLLLASAGCLAAQSQRPEDLAPGKILVAPRDVLDPLFAQTVILIVRYNRTGAVGLALNRRTTLPISRALKEIPGSSSHPDPVYVGGPVELNTVMAVARTAKKPDGAEPVFGNIYLIAAKPTLEKALGGATTSGDFRVYLGYCGWGPRQLEAEMSRKGWYIFDRSENLAFDGEPATLWSRLVGKTEMQIARIGFRIQK